MVNSRLVDKSGFPSFDTSWRRLSLPTPVCSVAMSFVCPDCAVEKDNGLKYIVKFHDERGNGACARDRRVDNHSEGDRIQCVPCHNLLARIRRLTKRDGCSEDWGVVDKEKRKTFMKECSSLMGDELSKQISCVITESKVFKQMTEFTGAGGFLDEDDLKEVFKNKPDQLRNVQLNAPQITCPIRKVTLYQNPEYKLSNSVSEDSSRTMTREASQEQKVKPAKKAKAAPKRNADAIGEAAGVEKTISQPQSDKLAKLKDNLTKFFSGKVNIEKARLETEPKVKELIPSFALVKFEIQLATFEQLISHLEVAIATKKSDHKKITDAGKDACKEMKATTDSMKLFIDEAEAHLASAGA